MAFDLFDFLPMLYREADATDGGFQSFAWSFNSMVNGLLTVIEDMPQNLVNPQTTPMIGNLADHRGNPFSCLTDDQLRKVADNLTFIYQRRGSASGMVNVVRFIVGLEIVMTMDYTFCWKLGLEGRGELGDKTLLSSKNSPLFRLAIPSAATDDQKTQILAILQFMKPNYLCYQVQSSAPAVPFTVTKDANGMSNLLFYDDGRTMFGGVGVGVYIVLAKDWTGPYSVIVKTLDLPGPGGSGWYAEVAGLPNTSFVDGVIEVDNLRDSRNVIVWLENTSGDANQSQLNWDQLNNLTVTISGGGLTVSELINFHIAPWFNLLGDGIQDGYVLETQTMFDQTGAMVGPLSMKWSEHHHWEHTALIQVVYIVSSGTSPELNIHGTVNGVPFVLNADNNGYATVPITPTSDLVIESNSPYVDWDGHFYGFNLSALDTDGNSDHGYGTGFEAPPNDGWSAYYHFVPSVQNTTFDDNDLSVCAQIEIDIQTFGEYTAAGLMSFEIDFQNIDQSIFQIVVDGNVLQGEDTFRFGPNEPVSTLSTPGHFLIQFFPINPITQAQLNQQGYATGIFSGYIRNAKDTNNLGTSDVYWSIQGLSVMNEISQ